MKHPPILRLLATLLLALTATAATAFEVDGINYTLNNQTDYTVSVTGLADPFYRNIYIPSHIYADGCQYTVTAIGNSAFYECHGITSVSIPNSVTSIGYAAFAYCDYLTSVSIPNSVTTLGKYAFYGCSALTAVSIPNSITEISEGAFAYCSGLTSVTFGNSVTEIQYGAFAYCTGLTSVTIGNSVTSIGSYAFAYCTGLSSVTIPNSITKISEGAFAYCSALTSVSIPNSVTSLGEYAFYGCSKLASAIIGDGIKTFNDYSFGECSKLVSITIGCNINYIPILAFTNCSSLQMIISRAITPPKLDWMEYWDGSEYYYYWPFMYADTSIARLYVPTGSKSAYNADKNWGRFMNIYEYELGNEDVSIDGGMEVCIEGRLLSCGGIYTEVYTLTGVKVYGGNGEVELAAGVYIVVANGRTTKVYIK